MKLVIFDCDGTIVDSQHAIATAMYRAFEAHGLSEPARNDVLGVVGLSLIEAIQKLLPGEADRTRIEAIADDYKRAFSELRLQVDHHEPLFEGARGVLELLSARDDMVLGIATGKSRRGVDALFEREDLARHFITVQTADDHPSKPHPSMIERAMREAGSEPQDTLMIGDTTYDIEMAQAARVGSIGVSWGYHPLRLLQHAGARKIVSAYAELPSAIDLLLTPKD